MQPLFSKVLIANRGEIAVRIIRTCRELGIRTLVVHSTADADSMAVRLADESVCIGGPAPSASYLRMDAIIQVALARGADAVHPGYGFLAENAEFAARCQDAGLVFVGPEPDSIRRLGDKSAARELAREVGVPVIPGSTGAVSAADAPGIAAEIGFPLLLKASAGGGGKGMRFVHSPDGLASALEEAQGEAESAFGDGTVYVERFVGDARHIEIQVVGDGRGTVIHLGERDCSIQRRYQKLIEESPSSAIDDATRDAIASAAVRLCSAVNYRGAGTVEFLFDSARQEFYFIEMNTRLQVEHGVTEMTVGIDLVALQLEVAAGLPLSLRQDEVRPRGHAIEFRINAEDMTRGFAPNAGRIGEWAVPAGPFVRVDTFCGAGDLVSPFYDSMIAKLLVWGRDREDAIRRSRRALDELSIGGLATTRDLHRRIVDDPAFVSGDFNTAWLADWLPTVLDGPEAS